MPPVVPSVVVVVVVSSGGAKSRKPLPLVVEVMPTPLSAESLSDADMPPVVTWLSVAAEVEPCGPNEVVTGPLSVVPESEVLTESSGVSEVLQPRTSVRASNDS
jgi:hypothetical protein